MTIIHSTDDYAVEQIPIEQIQPGDTLLAHLPDGSPYTFVVDLKRFEHNKAAGEAPKIILEAARETDTHGTGLVASTQAPVGTLTHRIIRQP